MSKVDVRFEEDGYVPALVQIPMAGCAEGSDEDDIGWATIYLEAMDLDGRKYWSEVTDSDGKAQTALRAVRHLLRKEEKLTVSDRSPSEETNHE